MPNARGFLTIEPQLSLGRNFWRRRQVSTSLYERRYDRSVKLLSRRHFHPLIQLGSYLLLVESAVFSIAKFIRVNRRNFELSIQIIIYASHFV